MGKKSTKKTASNSNSTSNDDKLLPFVSICTPTYNRRPFWPMAIQCFNDYDYPKDRMEWIIVDDGTDSIEDLVKDIPQVKYFREEKQMVLGRKRNYMHEKSKGDIIVYQDDDDYYPPERISHAVEKLMSDPNVLAGGSTVLFLYFKHIQQMYRFGPYSHNHATAGTFAFKRQLLKESKYDDFKALAEEKDFLKGYTVPFIQFDPLKTILVFSHNHNTFDKKKLLQHAPNPTCNPDMNITVDHIVKSESAKKFFLEDIDELLAAYEPGDVKNKPEVLNQTKLIEESREKQIQELAELRRETMANKDVQQFKAEMQAALDNTKRDMSRIFEVNKRLVHRMKEIKHLLTEEDKKLMDETSKAPPICNLTIEAPKLRITQTEAMLGADVESIQNIFRFIDNHEVVINLVINDTERQQVNFKCQLEFAPHPAAQHLYGNSQQTNQINLNRALASQQSTNASEEDIQTIMEQTECNRATAINALSKEDGDIIASIMNIDNHKCEDVPNVPNVPSSNFSEEDIQTIMEQTECNRATAINALTKEDGDIVACIMNIDNHKCDDVPNVPSSKFSEEDIQTIMEQTECNRATAINALTKEDGDIVGCIMNIDSHRCNSLPEAAQPSQNEMIIQGVDIDTIKKNTGCNELTALQALVGESNNIEKAMLNIEKYKVSDEASRQHMASILPQQMGATENIENNSGLNENDIETIMDQTGCDKDTAVKALKGEDNDIISSIMKIDEYKVADKSQESEEEVTLNVEG